jgi:hypothetical protein
MGRAAGAGGASAAPQPSRGASRRPAAAPQRASAGARPGGPTSGRHPRRAALRAGAGSPGACARLADSRCGPGVGGSGAERAGGAVQCADPAGVRCDPSHSQPGDWHRPGPRQAGGRRRRPNPGVLAPAGAASVADGARRAGSAARQAGPGRQARARGQRPRAGRPAPERSQSSTARCTAGPPPSQRPRARALLGDDPRFLEVQAAYRAVVSSSESAREAKWVRSMLSSESAVSADAKHVDATVRVRQPGCSVQRALGAGAQRAQRSAAGTCLFAPDGRQAAPGDEHAVGCRCPPPCCWPQGP